MDVLLRVLGDGDWGHAAPIATAFLYLPTGCQSEPPALLFGIGHYLRPNRNIGFYLPGVQGTST